MRIFLTLFLATQTLASERIVELKKDNIHLKFVTSETAQIFYIVDHISQWSPFSHRQFRKLIETDSMGHISKEDELQLQRHADFRRRVRYTIEPAFFTANSIDEALKQLAKIKGVAAKDLNTEKEVLKHFEKRVRAYIAANKNAVDKAAKTFVENPHRAIEALTFALHFLNVKSLDVPVYLFPSSKGAGGGGYNGDFLCVETSTEMPAGTLVHELFHYAARDRRSEMQTLAKNLDTDFETISESLTYAFSPGVFALTTGSENWLKNAVHQNQNAFFTNEYVRFNTLGLALRPSLETCVKANCSYEDFRPTFLAVLNGVFEIERAKLGKPQSAIFVFGAMPLSYPFAKNLGKYETNIWARENNEKNQNEFSQTIRKTDVEIYIASQLSEVVLPQRHAQLQPQLKSLSASKEGTCEQLSSSLVVAIGKDAQAIALACEKSKAIETAMNR